MIKIILQFCTITPPGSGWRGSGAAWILERFDTKREGQYRDKELETSADGEGRGRPAVDGGRHIGRVDVGRNAQDPSVQVEATAPEPRRGGQEQIVETVAVTQPRAPRLGRLSPRRGEPLSNYL